MSQSAHALTALSGGDAARWPCCCRLLDFSDAEALRVAAGFKHQLSLGAVQLGMHLGLASSACTDPVQLGLANASLAVAVTGQLVTINKVVTGLLGLDRRPASAVAAFVRDTAVPSDVVLYLERLSTSVTACLDPSCPGEFFAIKLGRQPGSSSLRTETLCRYCLPRRNLGNWGFRIWQP